MKYIIITSILVLFSISLAGPGRTGKTRQEAMQARYTAEKYTKQLQKMSNPTARFEQRHPHKSTTFLNGSKVVPVLLVLMLQMNHRLNQSHFHQNHLAIIDPLMTIHPPLLWGCEILMLQQHCLKSGFYSLGLLRCHPLLR